MEFVKTLGEIAGVAGLAFGLVIVIFRDVIRKAIFPQLTKEQGFKILRTIIVLSFIFAILGLMAWTYLDYVAKQNDSSAKRTDVFSPYILTFKFQNQFKSTPIAFATVQLKISGDSALDKNETDSQGKCNFVINRPGTLFRLIFDHKDFAHSVYEMQLPGVNNQFDLYVPPKANNPTHPKFNRDLVIKGSDPLAKAKASDVEKKNADAIGERAYTDVLTLHGTAVRIVYVKPRNEDYLKIVDRLAEYNITPEVSLKYEIPQSFKGLLIYPSTLKKQADLLKASLKDIDEFTLKLASSTEENQKISLFLGI